MKTKSSRPGWMADVYAATAIIIIVFVILVSPFLLLFAISFGATMIEQLRGDVESWHLGRWLNKQDVVEKVNLDYEVSFSTDNSLTGGIKLSVDTNAADACALIGETIATVNNERKEHFYGGYDLGLKFRWIYHNAIIEDNFDYVSIDPRVPDDPKVNLMHHCDSIEYATSAVDNNGARAVDIWDGNFLIKRWDEDAAEDEINAPAAIFENDRFGRTTSDNYSDWDNWQVKVKNLDKEKIGPVSKFINYITSISPLSRSTSTNSPEIYINTSGLTNPEGMTNRLEDNDTYIYIANYDEIRPHNFGEGELGDHLASFMKEAEARKVAVCNEIYAGKVDECEYFELNKGALEHRTAVVEKER